MEDSEVGSAFALRLTERIGTRRFELWLEAQSRWCIDATRLTIHATSEFVRDWLRKNLADDIRACWQTLAGQDATIEFTVEPMRPAAAEGGTVQAIVEPCRNSVSAKRRASGGCTVTKQHAVASPARKLPRGKACAQHSDGHRPDDNATKAVSASAGHSPSDNLGSRHELIFPSFVVGESNEYAYTAAQLTASRRQQASPVVFVGPTGVGKTHLLRAIAREYRRLNPASIAVYLTAEQFTTSFIEAIRGTGLPSFRQKCRGADLLIIDDLQFFVGKDRTLEELQYTIDTLIADGRQIVLASDRPLAELRGLGRELTSRLAGGLLCELSSPEFATRIEIARRLSRQIDLVASDNVLAYVAAEVNAGARELRGALHRLHAMSLAFNEPVSRDLAERAIGDLVRHSARTVRLADVQKVVCDEFGIEPSQLRSDRKSRAISDPRILAMWLARKYTRAPWSEIAQFFGRRSHSTVISAHRRVEQLISTNGKVDLSDRSCNVEEAIRRLENALRTA